MRTEDITVWLMCPGDRPHWQAQWVDPLTGGRRTRSLKTDDEHEARKRAQVLEDRLRAGLPADEERLTWAAFRARFMAEHASGLRPRSRETLAVRLDALERHCRPATPRAVDARMLARFAAAMRTEPQRGGKEGMAPWTIRNYLAAVRGALAWAASVGLVERVPEIPSVKVPKLRPRPVADADYRKLSEAAPSSQWRALLACAWLAGLRLSEARALRRGEGDGRSPWIDAAAGKIWLPAAAVKADEDSWLPLHPDLAALLAALPERADGRCFHFPAPSGGELTRQGLSSRITLIARKAGVRLGMHALRKGFGSRLAGTAPAAVLQRLMRHASITTTMTFYCSADDASLQRAVDSLK